MSFEHTNDNDHTSDPVPGASPTGTMTSPPPPAPAPATSTSRPNPAWQVLAVLGAVSVAVVGALLFVVAVTVAVVIGAVVVAIESDVDEITHTPTTFEEIPTSIVSERADVVVDLTSVPLDEFDSRTGPVDIDVDVEFGSVRIVVPDGVAVDVDATTDLGSTNVFDRSDDGFDNRIAVETGADADLELTIDVGAGNIEVERSQG